MSQIVHQENQFDTLSRYIVRNPNIRRMELNGIVYYAMVDVLSVVADDERKVSASDFWKNVKRSAVKRAKKNDEVLNLHPIPLLDATGKRYQLIDGADWETVLVIVGRLSDKRAAIIYRYAMHFLAESGNRAMLAYRMRRLTEGGEWAADEIHEEMKLLPPPDPETPHEDRGYRS